MFLRNIQSPAVRAWGMGLGKISNISKKLVVSVNSEASLSSADNLQGLERILMDLDPARAINSEINKIFNLKG